MWWRRHRALRDLQQDIHDHLDQDAEDLVAGGMSPAEARRLARVRFGNPTLAAEDTRAVWVWQWAEQLWKDVRYALSSLARTPAFAGMVIATLALTIGPTTAIISVANWLIWRPPPGVVEPDRLAVVWFGAWQDTGSVSPRRVSNPNLTDLRAASRTMVDIAGWQEGDVSLAAGGTSPRRVGSAHADVRFLPLLGVRPVAGRSFTVEDDQPPFGSPVVMVSDSLARGLYVSPERAVGQAVTLNGRRVTIVGVLPPGFAGARPDSRVDVWTPSLTYYHLRHFSESVMQERDTRARSGAFYMFVARLVPGATAEALQAELDVLVPGLAEAYPRENEAFTAARARVFPQLGLQELQRDDFHALVRNLLIVGGVLLLLGCANVTNLLIVRGIRRQHERAVRVALGATRRRLAQLQLVESCVLALAGAALGVGLAVWLKQLIQVLLLPGFQAAGLELTVPMDQRVLIITTTVALACGLAAGLAPAWIGSSGQIGLDLSRGAGVRASRGGQRIRGGLAAAQLTLSLALVVNAVLLVATMRNLTGVDAGFDPVGVSVHSTALDDHGYTPDQAMVYNRTLLERLSSEPSLQAVTLSLGFPPSRGFRTRVRDARTGNGMLDVTQEFVTSDYFRTTGQIVLSGRTFTPEETMRSEVGGGVVMLSDSLARRLFGDAAPIGERVTVPGTAMSAEQGLLVVGVVADVRGAGSVLAGRPDLALYSPFASGGSLVATRPTVLVRSALLLRDVSAVVQAHASAIDPSLPIAAHPLTTLVGRELAGRRAFAWVLSLLGGLGFVVAGVGLYGLLSQSVSERTRELGIRMALGADRASVIGLVLRQAVWIAVFGSAAGLSLAAFGSRLVETQLFGVTRLEPWVYGASATGLTAVVLAASLWPARTATRIQPAQALRTE